MSLALRLLRSSPDASATSPTTGTVITNAYLTYYSWWDSSPAGAPVNAFPLSTGNPTVHDTAGGTGTYDDPITCAVGWSDTSGSPVLDYPVGTRFYAPYLQRYFIVEDLCGDLPSPSSKPCHSLATAPSGATTWVSVWLDGRNGTLTSTDSCMAVLSGLHTLVRNPRADYPVTIGAVYGSSCPQTYSDVVPAPPPAGGGSDLTSTMTSRILAVHDDAWESSAGTLDLRYWSNWDLGQSNSNITKAVVVLHDAARDAATHAGYVATAATSASVLTSTLIVAPKFSESTDVTGNDARTAYWPTTWWNGALSLDYPYVRPWRLSSFTALDQLIAAVGNTARYPNLTQIVVAGHGPGGSMANRHAALTLPVPAVPTRYVVANAYSYLFFDDQRYTATGTRRPLTTSEQTGCPTWDQWPYGMNTLNTYAAQSTSGAIRARYAAKTVQLLLGSSDNTTAGDSTCMATWQGQAPYQRGNNYYSHLGIALGAAAYGTNSRTVVSGIGHDPAALYNSTDGRTALFGTASAPPSQDPLTLTEWMLELPLGSLEQLSYVMQPGLAVYSGTYFSNANGRVILKAPVDGMATLDNQYPLCELRHMSSDGQAPYNWSTTSGRYDLRVRCAITHLPNTRRQVVFARIKHDSGQIALVLNGGRMYVSSSGTQLPDITTTYALGTIFTIELLAENGVVSIFYNGSKVGDVTGTYSGAHFRVGCYLQGDCDDEDINECSGNNYGEVEIYDIDVLENESTTEPNPSPVALPSGDHRRYIHGLNLVRHNGKILCVFAANNYPPTEPGSEWQHDIYYSYVDESQPNAMFNPQPLVSASNAQEPASAAVNNLGSLLVTAEDAQFSDLLDQTFGIWSSALVPTVGYGGKLMAPQGGHSGHVAASGSNWLVVFGDEWDDTGGVDNQGTGVEIYARIIAANGALGELISVSTEAPNRDWWPTVAGSSDRWLAVWQRYGGSPGTGGGPLMAVIIGTST